MTTSKAIVDILDDVQASITVKDHQRPNLLQRIEIACAALRGQEREPDKGPWSVSEDGRSISSDNFVHDVQLKVSGDFYDDEDRRAYARRLATQLNEHKPLSTGLPKEPPAGLLHSMALRTRHDFGLTKIETDGPLTSGVTREERIALLDNMRRFYEEVAGHGFFKYSDT